VDSVPIPDELRSPALRAALRGVFALLAEEGRRYLAAHPDDAVRLARETGVDDDDVTMSLDDHLRRIRRERPPRETEGDS